MDLKYSRKNRLIYYLSSVISKEDAEKVYIRLDELPDYVCQNIDAAVYDDLVFEKIIEDYR